MRGLFIALVAGCATAAAAPNHPEEATPQASETACDHATEHPETASQLQNSVIRCALLHLRDGLRIEGEVDVDVQLDAAGAPSGLTVEVSPLGARDAMRVCVEASLRGPACSRARGSFALSSEIDLPTQDRPTVELGRDSARVVEPSGAGALAVGIEASGGVTESMARGALTIELHRVVETCFLRGAEAALRGEAPMDVRVPLTLQIVWQPNRAPRTRVARSPSEELTRCVEGLLGDAIRTPVGLTTTGAARCELPTRRYLHESVQQMLRER